MSRILRYLLIIGCAIGGILLFLLTSASENTDFFDKNYKWLFGVNAIVAGILLCLVILMLVRLYRRYKRGEFGSRLLARWVLLFAMTGIWPGVLIYVESVQFVSVSIESWFDVRVESALKSGLNLATASLETAQADLSVKAHNIASDLSDLSDGSQTTLLSRMRDQNQIQEAVIFTANGRIIATASEEFTTLRPELPNADVLRQARKSDGYAKLEGEVDISDASAKTANAELDAETSYRWRIVVEIPARSHVFSMENEARFLQLLQPVPIALATNAEAIRAADSDYKVRKLARTGLRKIYIVTLTLTLLLAIFIAIASAFVIAGNLTKPLLLLAEGTRAVAGGDFSPRPIVATTDELGTLTQSFNTMTRQLFEARSLVERNRAELENAKAYLESVLANMSAGVMVLDHDFRLISCNESVERILQHGFTPYLGQPLAAIEGLSSFAAAITKAFSEQSAQAAAGDSALDNQHWQHQIEIPRSIGGSSTDHDISLLTRGSRLPSEGGMAYVVVFDDISDVISAQRSIAWGEVARRLAHEIKNPLTPIQLSAERLQMKLDGKLGPKDMELLNKGTATIVNQVAAMKRMVDDFRDYAKTPQAVLLPLDLNALIEEVLHLYLVGDERDIIHLKLSPKLPLVMGDATQLRQVIHNLLQNAQDAVAEKNKEATAPSIDLITEAINYSSADGEVRTAIRLSVSDNGQGFSPEILARAFEPYVTSKPRGTGLGLPMVKKIIDEHGGRIDIQNRSDTSGAKILILLLKLGPVTQ